MSCFDCSNSTMLDTPKKCLNKDCLIYGYCHKNGGNYPIYVPTGKCNEHCKSNVSTYKDAKNKVSYEQTKLTI